MAKIYINSTTSTYIADQADKTYELKAGATMNMTATAIDGYNNAANRTFLINGTITSTTDGIQAGRWDAQPEHVDVTVGKTGHITAHTYAVYHGGASSTITNKGLVEATGAGPVIHTEGHGNLVDNQGTVHGPTGISVIGDHNKVLNSGTIESNYYGVHLNSTAGEHNSFINTGVIKNYVDNMLYAVVGEGGNERIVNSGLIVGYVSMDDGSDTFISKAGKVTGEIQGGDGDDTFVIDSGKFDLVEFASEGFDRVRSSASYVMDANIEEATLTGKADLQLTGSASTDLLYGNKGDNKITGHGGLDYINGKDGDDRLAGGIGAGDIFIFNAHSGHDMITDFEDGSDKINLASYAGIDDFSDLVGHFSKAGDDVLVSLLDGDTIRIRNIDLANLTADNFQF